MTSSALSLLALGWWSQGHTENGQQQNPTRRTLFICISWTNLCSAVSDVDNALIVQVRYQSL